MPYRKIDTSTLPPLAELMAKAEQLAPNPLPPTEEEAFQVVKHLYEVKRLTWTQIHNFFYEFGNRHTASGAWKSLYNRMNATAGLLKEKEAQP